jgi:hypothetical protein
MRLIRKKTLIHLGFGSCLTAVAFVLVFFLEYGVWNFGDSDLPPYQPDTLFENIMDGIWYLAGIATLFLGASFLRVLTTGLISSTKQSLVKPGDRN